MFKSLKARRAKRKARQKLLNYDKQYSRERLIAERPEPVHVEKTFDAFVAEFGGVKISELISKKAQMPLNADYLFEKHNVIAELKTLEGIYSGPDAFKQFSQAYIDSGCTGSDVMGFFWRGEKVPEDAAALMRKRIRRSIEQRIKKARKQLRKSKAEYGNDDTRCLILIAMDQKPIFGHQTMLFNLAKIMGDNYADEHTDGVVYFNPNMPTKFRADGMEMSGWYPFYRDEEVNVELSEFVNLLGNRWLNYYGRLVGETNPILELESEEEMTAALGPL
ncbi:MAG: hypothetical protein ABJF50_07315 [Paracoccaceae bacterium]|uniref:hypothetical protein n=1 Tax=Yoonia sp. TaxID=2212373 RepID=UPI00326DF90F